MWTYNQTKSNEIYHYGILGMKWGRRRYQNEDGTYTAAGKKRLKLNDDDDVKALSDDELRSRINRLQMEENYKNLESRLNSRPESKVKQLLNEAVVSLGRKSLEKVTNNIVDKMFNGKKEEYDPNKLFNLDPEKASAKELKDAVQYHNLQTSFSKIKAERGNGSTSSTVKTNTASKPKTESSSNRTYRSEKRRVKSKAQQKEWIKQRKQGYSSLSRWP